MRTIPTLLGAAALLCGHWAAAAEFTLRSPAIEPDGRLTASQVYNGFGCEGQNVSPALAWDGAPAGTRSFAVTVYDPDAPTGSGWWHWGVLNLPAAQRGLPEAAGDVSGAGLPAGARQVRTDFGVAAFGGACPPPGDRPHRYIFTVYALKTEKIEIPPDASAALAGYMIHANQIGKASFQAYYGRD